jgi:hypothetical protein
MPKTKAAKTKASKKVIKVPDLKPKKYPKGGRIDPYRTIRF